MRRTETFGSSRPVQWYTPDMKRVFILALCLTAFLPAVAYAQTSTDFSNALQKRLTGSTSSSVALPAKTADPSLGTSEVFQERAPSARPASEPYVAGNDMLSGLLATGAAVLGALVIILVFLIVAFSKHHEYEE